MAYRIWGAANPIGWDCDSNFLAAELGVTRRRIDSILRLKGWQTRVRANPRDRTQITTDGQDALMGALVD